MHSPSAKLLTALSSISASRFERIVASGVVEVFDPMTQLPRFFRTIKRIQAPGGYTLFDFVACSASRSTTHTWNNLYINGAFTVHALTLSRVRDLLELSGFSVQEIAGYSDHHERTFMEWYRRFQACWGDANTAWPRVSVARQRQPPQQRVAQDNAAIQRAGDYSLPQSFRRTWEFYLLHSAACYRAHVLQAYQLRVE
jgi:cyclopropane fatty-acyl-phospholipid synthase-like methyltransferase